MTTKDKKSTWELIAERADYSSLGAGDKEMEELATLHIPCLLYTSPSPRD